jgi:hypothetical protein
MACTSCLVGYSGFGDADPRAFAPVSPAMPLGRAFGQAVAPPSGDPAQVLVAFGVGAILGFLVLRTVLPSAAGGR